MLGIFTFLAVVAFSSGAQVAEMRKLDFLVGEWKGEGWELRLDGSRANSFSQKTTVQVKDDSSLRIQDNRGYRPMNGTLGASTLDATIFFDKTLNLYQWRGKGFKTTLEAKLLGDRTLQYGVPFSVPVEPVNGDRKTTIEVNENGEWHETLEVWWRDRWYKFEESILKRVK